MKLKDVLVVYTHPAVNESRAALAAVKNILRRHKIHFNLADRDKLRLEQFENRDLIIAIGGDGTFLRAAQFVKNETIFGVNADIKSKEGFFMEANIKNFDEKLRKIANNEMKISRFPRLEAYIDGEKIDALALNEFYIGPKKAYHAAKYIIRVGSKKERQKSSGVLVATPAGSYAWASACSKNRLPLSSKNFQFVVREPYQGKVFRNYKLSCGLLGRHQKIEIISEMLDGAIVADSVGREYQFKNGAKAVVGLSKENLHLLLEK